MGMWMWYPGDFEIYIGNRTMVRRDERLVPSLPFWELSSPYCNVVYKKKVNLKKSEKVWIRAGGICSIFDSQGRGYRLGAENKGTIQFPAGEYTLTVSVYSEQLPALQVEGDSISGGPDWMVSVNSRNECEDVLASYGEFEDAPWNFRLKTTEIYPVQTEQESNCIFLDFGIETFGYIKFKNIKGSGHAVIYYGESREEAESEDFCLTFDEIALKECVCYTHNRSRAMRFARVICDGISIEQVSLLYEYLPLKRAPVLSSSDPLVDRIYETAEYTLRLNTREVFLDGIKRDRWCWSGDAYQSILMNNYTYFDLDVTRRTLLFLRGKGKPHMHINHIPDYSFYWMISLYEHYYYTNDISYLRFMYPRAVELMEFCESLCDSNGFIIGRPEDWVFVDWADMEKRGALCVEQILFWKSYCAMSFLAEVTGDRKRESLYSQRASQLRRQILEIFWDEQQGLLRHSLTDGTLVEKNTKYANIFAVLYNFLDQQRRVLAIKNGILNSNIAKITTPYGRFYELCALCEAGMQKQVTVEMKDYWGGMLKMGATTFWEEYIPGEKNPYSMYHKPFGKSLCHAWGAGPTYLFGRYYLGIRPTAVGYETFEMKPNLGGLEWIKGAVPTPFGDIEAEISSSSIKVTVPSGMKGKLLLSQEFSSFFPQNNTVNEYYELELLTGSINIIERRRYY